VTEVAVPARDARPGGRWSTPSLVEDVLHLAAVERAVAHVTAGWVPKVPELDAKLRLADGLEGAMARAVALREHARTLLERDDEALRADPAWVEPLRALDRSADPVAVVDGVVDDAGAFLAARYRDLAGQLDPLYDARLLATVHTAVDALARRAGQPGPVAASLGAGRSSGPAEAAPLDALVWAPVDRVPVPARPAGRRRPLPGAMGHLRIGSRRELHNVAGELNENVTAELCALELLCRCAYEHPELAWSTQLGMARHAADESRHAAMFRRLLAERGIDEAGLPQHATNYELAYEFPDCEPGSGKELVWRLLLLCTVLEALAIDKIPPEIATLDWLDQPDIARALDYIAADELFHVDHGLRLTRELCAEHGLDPVLERELVHGRFFGRQRDLRSRYLEADPERAAQEIAALAGPDPDGVPFQSRTERELRRRVSFTEAEIDQVDRWGYNPRSAG